MTPLMQVSGLEKSFGGVKAVDGLDFDLHPGDQLLVLGDEQQGIALVKASQLQQFATDILKAMRGETEE